MQITVKALSATAFKKSECLIFLGNRSDLENLSALLPAAVASQATEYLKSSDYKAKKGNSHLIYGGKSIKRVMLLCSGKAKASDAESLAKQITHQLKKLELPSATLVLGESITQAEFACSLNQNLITASYRYTTTKASNKTITTKLSCIAKDKNIIKALKEGLSLGLGMNVTRELGNLPGNICTPDYLAKQAQALARKYPTIKTSMLNEKQLTEQGFGAFMSVAKGSTQKPRLISMEYQGAKKSAQPYVLVGKGITFDSGGISIKPGAAMDEMKYDMCGAASVFGVMNTIAELKLPINVVGVVAAAENMPSGGASKPGDVVTSLSGKTIEILNTDAEGRLVLCDTLTWVKKFKPETVIDIATLTGACIIALGHHASGLYANDEDLAQQLLAAGNKANDRAWQMPLWDAYKKQLRSPFADLGNIGGRSAGSVTAACFLSAFTEDYKWAHLDIAGTAWISGGSKGATGRPVPLLVEYLKSQC